MLGKFRRIYDYDHRTELSVQIRSVYFCIETCIGENINQKSYNRIIKLSASYIIVKYIRGGLALERFLPRGVEGADILFPRWKQTHVSKSAGNESGDIEARNEFWMRRHSANFFLFPLFCFFFDSWQDEVLNIAKIWLLNHTFNSKGQVLCLLRKMWNLTREEPKKKRVEMINQKKNRSHCTQHQIPAGWKQIETFLKLQ